MSYRAVFIDNSNACVKWLEDCIVRSGIIPDDSPKFCPAPKFVQVKCPKAEERTEIYVFKLHP